MIKKIACIVLLIVGAGWISSCGGDSVKKQTSYVKSETKQKTYYRVRTELEHDGIPVIFDVVVGCSVKITNHQDNGQSFFSSLFPKTYMIRIEGGHGVMMRAPYLCQGMEKARYINAVPKIIWYEDADDWQLGIGYASLDAYDNPNSQLKLISNDYSVATKAEFDAFVPRALKENLIPQDKYHEPYIPPSKEVMLVKGYDIQWRLRHYNFNPQCYGVKYFPLDEEKDRALIREFWPAHKPKYWVYPKGQGEFGKTFHDLMNRLFGITGKIRFKGGALSNGIPVAYYFNMNYDRYNDRGRHYNRTQYRNDGRYSDAGIPGPDSPLKSPIYYPVKDEREIGFTEAQLRSGQLDRLYDFDGGNNKGFLYCQGNWNLASNWYGEDIRHLAKPKCLVDGEEIYAPPSVKQNICQAKVGTFFYEDKALIMKTQF